MTTVELLQQLVALPSVNPMGRNLESDDLFEERVSDFLVGYFRDHNILHERIEVVQDDCNRRRCNVVAIVEGAAGSPTILLDAHQDTVPVDSMTIPPFEPTIRDGKLFGRGSCDVKGGLAVMLTTLVRLATEPRENHATVILTCTCDEEFGQLGARDVVDLCKMPNPARSNLLTRLPDAAIVAEPTELNVVVSHRGAARWSIATGGIPAHSSDPSQGVSAIYRMGKLLVLLEKYASELSKSKFDPLCGDATLSVGLIRGGESINAVPAHCSIDIDRRILPGESHAEAMSDVQQYLRDRVDFDFQMLPPMTLSDSLPHQQNTELGAKLLENVQQIDATRQIIGVPYGCHAARYAAAGIPSVVFGPGSILQAHTNDEWIDIEHLDDAADILHRFLMDIS